MRYLAVDYGEKRTGLAVCDEGETIASPLKVVEGQGGLMDKIIDAVESEIVGGIVIGLPLNMDGTQGEQAKGVLGFGERLKKHLEIPIFFHDERLSSFGAEQKLSGIGMTRKQKKKRLDAVAAAAILQSFLDSKHG